MKNNIIINRSNIKLCLNNKNGSSENNNDNINMTDKKDIKGEYLYVLENRGYNFPKKESTPQFLYFFANVSKYCINYNLIKLC